MSRYLVFEVGCIECGEPSSVLRLTDDVNEAQAVAEAAHEHHVANWGGQRYQVIYDLDTDGYPEVEPATVAASDGDA